MKKAFELLITKKDNNVVYYKNLKIPRFLQKKIV